MEDQELLDDEDEWFELERDAPIKHHYEVEVTTYAWRPRGRTSLAWIALIVMRGEPLKWAIEHGPRFKVQVGGKAANRVRLQPDQEGRFELCVFKSGKTAKLALGNISAWPDEKRERTQAISSYDAAGNLVLSLPSDWAIAKQPTKPKPESTPKTEPKFSFPVSTQARGLTEAVKAMRTKEAVK